MPIKEEEFDLSMGYRRYLKILNEDIKRFVQLEKGWISQISHKIMPTENGFVHEDRANLRKRLLKELNSCIHIK